MGLFGPAVWSMIRRDKVKIRGSARTSRLRKKRLKHMNELYEEYRDRLILHRHGVTFLEWRQANDYEERWLIT